MNNRHEQLEAFRCGHLRTEQNTKRVRNGTGIACRTCFRAHDAAYRAALCAIIKKETDNEH